MLIFFFSHRIWDLKRTHLMTWFDLQFLFSYFSNDIKLPYSEGGKFIFLYSSQGHRKEFFKGGGVILNGIL